MSKLFKQISLLAIIIFAASQVFAANADAVPTMTAVIPQNHPKEVRDFLQQIVDVNLRYKEEFHSIIDEATLEQQQPYATLILCSDSRVDSDIVSDKPTGELFVIRNIGNQMRTAFGSVEYGVRDLKTEVLLIIGHSQCGAVKAAMTDYTKLPANVRSELKTIDADPKETLNQNIVRNVNHQVQQATNTFSKKIKQGQLAVIGMVYDMHNDFKYGHGQLILVNINNETSPKVLAEHHYIKGVEHLVILDEKY